MSRSGYSDDCDGWELIRWRGAVASAIRGKRGQAFLRELLAAIDALPEKRLIKDELVDEQGGVCALGAVGRARGLAGMEKIEVYDRPTVADTFGISEALAAEIMFENDGDFRYRDDPETRFSLMREWVVKHIEATP